MDAIKANAQKEEERLAKAEATAWAEASAAKVEAARHRSEAEASAATVEAAGGGGGGGGDGGGGGGDYPELGRREEFPELGGGSKAGNGGSGKWGPAGGQSWVNTANSSADSGQSNGNGKSGKHSKAQTSSKVLTRDEVERRDSKRSQQQTQQQMQQLQQQKLQQMQAAAAAQVQQHHQQQQQMQMQQRPSSPQQQAAPALCPGWRKRTESDIHYYQNVHTSARRHGAARPNLLTDSQLKQWQSEPTFQYEVQVLIRWGTVGTTGIDWIDNRPHGQPVVQKVADDSIVAQSVLQSPGLPPVHIVPGMILDRVNDKRVGAGTSLMACRDAIRSAEEACLAKRPILLCFKHPWQRKKLAVQGQAVSYYNSMTNHEQVQRPDELDGVLARMQALDRVRWYPDSMTPKLEVKVKNCRNLVPMDTNGLSDPYVKLELNGVEKRTEVQRKTLDPEFLTNKAYVFHPGMLSTAGWRSQELLVHVYDYDRVTSDDYEGEVRIQLAGSDWFGETLPSRTTAITRTLQLQDLSSNKDVQRKMNEVMGSGVGMEELSIGTIELEMVLTVPNSKNAGTRARATSQIQPPEHHMARQNPGATFSSSIALTSDGFYYTDAPAGSGGRLERGLSIAVPQRPRAGQLDPGQECKVCRKWIAFSSSIQLIEAFRERESLRVASGSPDRPDFISETEARQLLDLLPNVEIDAAITAARDTTGETGADGLLDCIELLTVVMEQTEDQAHVDEETGAMISSPANAIAAVMAKKERAVCDTCSVHRQKWIEEDRAKQKQHVCYGMATVATIGYMGLLLVHKHDPSAVPASVETDVPLFPLVPIVPVYNASAEDGEWRECGGAAAMGVDGHTVVSCLACTLVQCVIILSFRFGFGRQTAGLRIPSHHHSQLPQTSDDDGGIPIGHHHSQSLSDSACVSFLQVMTMAFGSGVASFFIVWMVFGNASAGSAYALISYGILLPWLVLAISVIIGLLWLSVVYFMVCKWQPDKPYEQPQGTTLAFTGLLAVVIGAFCDNFIVPLSDCDLQRSDYLVVLGVGVFTTHMHLWLTVSLVPKLATSSTYNTRQQQQLSNSSYDDFNSDDDDDDDDDDGDGASSAAGMHANVQRRDAKRQADETRRRSLCCGLLTAPSVWLIHGKLADTESAAAALAELEQPDHDQSTKMQALDVKALHLRARLTEEMNRSWAKLRSSAGKMMYAILATSSIAVKVSGQTFGHALGYGFFIPWLVIALTFGLAGVIFGLWRTLIALYKSTNTNGTAVSPMEWWHHASTALLLLSVSAYKFIEDMFEYDPADNSASTGVACLVLVFHLALCIALVYRQTMSMSRGIAADTTPKERREQHAAFAQIKMQHTLRVVLEKLHRRQNVWIYLGSAVGSAVTAWLLTGYTLSSIIVSGILPAVNLLLVLWLGSALYHGVVENEKMVHKTAEAVDELATHWVREAQDSNWAYCGEAWPQPKALVHQLPNSDDGEDDAEIVGLRRDMSVELSRHVQRDRPRQAVVGGDDHGDDDEEVDEEVGSLSPRRPGSSSSVGDLRTPSPVRSDASGRRHAAAATADTTSDHREVEAMRQETNRERQAVKAALRLAKKEQADAHTDRACAAQERAKAKALEEAAQKEAARTIHDAEVLLEQHRATAAAMAQREATAAAEERDRERVRAGARIAPLVDGGDDVEDEEDDEEDLFSDSPTRAAALALAPTAKPEPEPEPQPQPQPQSQLKSQPMDKPPPRRDPTGAAPAGARSTPAHSSTGRSQSRHEAEEAAPSSATPTRNRSQRRATAPPGAAVIRRPTIAPASPAVVPRVLSRNGSVTTKRNKRMQQQQVSGSNPRNIRSPQGSRTIGTRTIGGRAA